MATTDQHAGEPQTGVAVTETDLRLSDGRTLHVYETIPAGETSPGSDSGRLPVFWHHGTPNLGAPPEPLFAAADRLGLRWVSFDRPNYGGSTPHPGRTMASVAADVAEVADALSIDRFAVAGHSGGSTHALACGAVLTDRVVAVLSIAAVAPYGVAGLDWFAGMAPAGVASLTAALQGREAKERHQAAGEELDLGFTDADWAILSTEWSWLGKVVEPALAAGPAGLIDDDLAYVSPWGCDPAQITAPVLLLHGSQDRVVPSSHSEWLAGRCSTAELRLSPDDGHLSILSSAGSAMDWLGERAAARR